MEKIIPHIVWERKRHTVEAGLYLLRVAADCRVQDRDWTLLGVAHLQAQLAVAPDILTHQLPLNITTLIPQELLQSRIELASITTG